MLQMQSQVFDTPRFHIHQYKSLFCRRDQSHSIPQCLFISRSIKVKSFSLLIYKIYEYQSALDNLEHDIIMVGMLTSEEL